MSDTAKSCGHSHAVRSFGLGFLLAGVAAGSLAAGAALVWFSTGAVQENRLPSDFFPPELATRVEASTAQGVDNFAVATGPVDNGIEAFYFLDFITGDLRAVAMNSRRGKFGAFYRYNIANDFDLRNSKNPKYLMVTGMADIPRGKGSTQIASSVVYITEATTGQMSAYVMPWSSSMQAAGQMQEGTFLKVGSLALRTSFVRDQ